MSKLSVAFRVVTFSLIFVVSFVFAISRLNYEVGAETTVGSSEMNQLETSVPLTIGVCDTAGPIEIESTGGTVVPTAYPTLAGAFAAIVAGTHTGTINVEVCGNTTETVAAELTASGVGAASYTSIIVRPVGGARVIEGSIIGAIIKLNGADNVTIDGRQGGIGTARDLTVRNNNTSAATAAVWLASVAAGNGASNNTIRNLELAAGATQNTLTVSTFGIIMCGTTISTTANGVDNDNNSFLANRIIRARYGIVTRGTTTDLNISPVVTDNIIGPAAFGADQIGKVGIFMQADTGALVSRNTVQFVGGSFANTTSGADRVGIGIGSESWSMTPGTLTSNTYTVTRNIVRDVIEERTFSSVGINLGTTGGGSATNNLVANNFIFNVKSNGTSGDQAVGLGIAGGLGDRVVFNSISMTGDVDPDAGAVATTNFGSGIRVGNNTGSTHGNLTLSNNSVYMDLSSSSAPTARYYAISGPINTFNWGTGGENYNNLYINPANTQLQTGGLGTTAAVTLTTQFATLANWQTAYTTPAAQDANSIQADPLNVSNTADLHIAVASPNVNAGLAVSGVTRDIDNQIRVAAPDIGADEPSGTAPAANDIEASVILVPANGAAFSTGATTTPQARFTNVGSATQTMRTVTFTIIGPGGLTYSNSQTIASIAVDEVVNVTFPTTPAFPTAGIWTMTASTAADSNTGNDSVAGSFIVFAPITGGTVNVGTGETYTSLTNPGGIFQAINSGVVTSNITVNITSNLSGETGTVTLNEIAGSFTTLIKPSGAARTISGAAPAAGGLLGFNSTDRVTIDGSLAGGTDRSLTVMPSNTANNGGGIYFASGINGAQNNVIKNVNVFSNGSITGTLLGISFASSTFGAVGVDNDNNRIENNDVRGSFYGIASLGASAANKDTGLVITRNVMPATGTAGIGRVGIYIVFADGALITENNIASVSNPGAADTIGIAAGGQALSSSPLTTGGISNSIISRNYVGVVSNNATFSAAGIVIASDVTGTNNVTNNMVTGVIGNSNAGDIVAGIYVNGLAGSTQNIYHNSVSMTGDRLPITANMLPSYALAIATDQPTNVRDNVLVNSQTRTGSTGGGGESYAIGFDGPAANVNLLSNNNDLFVSGPIGVIGITGDLITAAQTTTAGTGTNQATLAFWQTATSEDAASITVDPLFTSITDLHIPSGSPLVNAGADVGVTIDFDGQTRDATRDIGADEFVPTADLSITKTDGVTTATPGGSVTYTITASNAGPIAVVGATVADTFPAALTATWTCVGALGGTCSASGSGNIGDTVNLPVGGSVTYTAVAAISASATGTLVNTATVSSSVSDPNPANNTATDTDTLVPSANLGITKTDGVTTATPGGSVTYTIVASNAGPSNVTGATVADTFPAVLTATWTCVGAGGGTCTAAGSGNIGDTVNLPVGGSVTYTAVAAISASATGTLVNTATVSSSVADPTPGNNSATDTDTLVPSANLGITKTDGVTTVNPGGVTTYTIVASNSGPSNVSSATVADTFPASITAVSWTCVGAGGGTCTAAGTGNINSTVNLPAGGSVTFSAVSTISGSATGTIANTATVASAVTDPNPGNNSATDTNTVNVANGNFSINDVRVNEGNSGTSTATFTVTYTAGGAAAINLSTSNVTATAGSDYVTNNGTLSFPASASTQTQSFNVTVNGDTAKEANEVFRVTLTGGGTITDGIGFGVIRDEDRSYFADFDDDLKADYSVHRQSDQRHYILRSSNGTNFATTFGLATDVAIPGDYDGDGKTDIALYRPSTSTYYAINSSDSTVSGFTIGVAGDTPVQGDFTGDGRTDLATFRPSNGLWTIYSIPGGTTTATIFGISTDRPVQADYDGDNKTDIAVYRDGTWYILRSSDSAVSIQSWGVAADKPVSGDFDGDGRFDLAIYRNGQWWVVNSLNGNTSVIAWGLATDVTAPADYDGDGTTDVAVFRPSSGDWYVLQSSNMTITGVNWGLAGDRPIPNRYHPQ